MVSPVRFRSAARLRIQSLRVLAQLECRIAPATVGVDAAQNVHTIDPNIYGAAFATSAQVADLHLTINRNGGNGSDTYSYPQDATNHASDWYFESIAAGSGNGQSIDSYVSDTQAGGAQPSLTLNLFDWAAKLGAGGSVLGAFPVSVYGAQQSTDPWAPNFGNGVYTNGTNITGNDPNLAYSANSPASEQAWIQHLINTFGDSQHGGVQYYTLGNEPGIWNETHRDIHPAGDTLTELRDRIIAYASMVKSLDPNAKILGPEEWGWTNYFISGADAAAQNWSATYNGMNAEAWLLDQLRQHDAASGQRLIDYFTLHFYPQGGQFSDDVSQSMELLRNRSTRSLWDPNYVDESWIANTGIDGGKVNLINRMKQWVNSYYPGTKIGLTEYNWGAEGDMNGATTQADIWGIFGREGLDLANRWTTPATGSPAYLAMKMFRNYDGNGSGFGETSVGASVDNPDQVSAFAARRADGTLTVMAINKNLYDSSNPSAKTSITVNLSNFTANGIAQEWQLAATNPANQGAAGITHLSDDHFTGSSFTLDVPMESISLFVIKPGVTAPLAPTGLSATAGDHQIALIWNAVTGATSYNVYRGATSGGETPLQSGLPGTSFTDTGLTNGTTYYYQVTAVNAGGESPLSLEVSSTPIGLPPASPTNLVATPASSSQIDLTWNDNSNNETGFVIEYAPISNFATGLTTINIGSNMTSYSVTGLSSGTTYWFRVRATNAGLDSSDSNVANATTMATAVGGGLSATYFDNDSFGSISVSRTDQQINFDWRTSDPIPGIVGDTYSVRWTGQIQVLVTGKYRFRTYADHGVEFWLNDELLIKNWSNRGARNKTSAPIMLFAGQKYDITMEFVEYRGGTVQLLWQPPKQRIYSLIPKEQLYTPPTTGNGLRATYFNSLDFKGSSVTRIDSNVDFNWGLGAPMPGIAADTFSVRWTGQILADVSGTYTFRTNSDDRVRLWVNGQILIDNWQNHSATFDTASIALMAGQRYDIKVEYEDVHGDALMQLTWMKPGQGNFVSVPQTNLFSAPI
jgi:hypothetical protein